MTLANPDIPLNALTRLAARRTGLALHRTRLAEERTLMAAMRTAIMLIGFGFALGQAPARLPRPFSFAADATDREVGLALIAIGVLALAGSIAFHLHATAGLRRLRASMRAEGLVYGESVFPPSLTLVTALLLLVVALAAFFGVEFAIAPFG